MPPQTYNFHQDFFEDPIVNDLGYSPRIEIKPAHLANGLFHAACGRYANNFAQHAAINFRDYPVLSLDDRSANARLKSLISSLTSEQKVALTFLGKNPNRRRMLNTLLTADKTVFKTPNFSSYTLSHASHITSDNHDRGTGSWLVRILSHGDDHTAIDLLIELLNQDALQRNDELSVLTLPLEIPIPPTNIPRITNQPYESLKVGMDGDFSSPIVRLIRDSFNILALNDRPYAEKGGKLDTLNHFVTLGCFSVYLHLLNGNANNSFVPMVFRFEPKAQTLKQASQSSYQKMLKAIDNYLHKKIFQRLTQISITDYGAAFVNNEQVVDFINSLKWQLPRARTVSTEKLEKYRSDCMERYTYYRAEGSNYSPLEALSITLHEMLNRILSSRPQDVARALGTRIGLLSQYGANRSKTYEPHPDLIEVLVRASVSRGSSVSLRDLASQWANNFGILTGVLGDENERLTLAGLPSVDHDEWMDNANALAELLENSGYARRYADGVVLITLN
jgi:hypothetical protein